MRKLAINSFIAITAMAWGATDLRAASSGTQPSATMESMQNHLRADRRGPRGFDQRARALLSSWRAGQRPQPQPGAGQLPVIGARLEIGLLAHARTVPAHIREQLGTGHAGLMDLLVGELLVRVERDTLRIVDVLA